MESQNSSGGTIRPDAPNVDASQDADHLVITVHGIRTFGRWQERLEMLVHDRDLARRTAFASFKIGYFSALAFLAPPLRWVVTRNFRREFKRLASSREWRRIDIVAHSFGTHVIAWALWSLRHDSNVRVHTVILSGSVLRGSFAWSELLRGTVFRVVNDCGTKDAILLLSQFFVLFTGMAGRTGFRGVTNDRLRNRFSPFGHSGYFVDAKGKPSDVYMRDNWSPLLLGNAPTPLFGYDPADGVWGGISVWLGNNAEPVKLAAYLAPVVYALLAVWGLYTQSIAGVVENLTNSAITAVAAGDARSGALLLDDILRLPAGALPKETRSYTAHLLEHALAEPIAIRRYGIGIGPFEYVGFMDHDQLIVSVGGANAGARTWTFATSDRSNEWQPMGLGYLLSGGIGSKGSYVSTDGRNTALTRFDRYHGVLRFPLSSAGIPYGQVTTWSVDDSVVAVAQLDTVTVYDGYDGSQRCRVFLGDQESTSVALSDDGQLLLIGLANGALALWTLDGCRSVSSSSPFTAAVTAVGFIDARQVLAASESGAVVVIDRETALEQLRFQAHDANLISAETDPSHTRLITASSRERVAKIWDLRTGTLLYRLAGHTQRLVTAAYAPDGTLALTVSWDGTAVLWQVPSSSATMVTLARKPATGTRASLASDVQLAAVRANRDELVLLDTVSGGVRERLGIPAEGVIGIPATISADGSWVGFAIARDVPAIWRPPEASFRTLPKHDGSIYAVSFSHSETRMATASWDQTVALWDLATFDKQCALKHDAGTYFAVWNRSDTRLVSGSSDGLVKIWDVSARNCPLEPIRAVEAHNGTVYAAAFVDDDHFATGGTDGRIRLWSTNGAAPLRTFAVADEPVRGLSMCGEETLVGWTDSGRVVATHLPSGNQLYEYDIGVSIASLVCNVDAAELRILREDGYLQRTPIARGTEASTRQRLDALSLCNLTHDEVGGGVLSLAAVVEDFPFHDTRHPRDCDAPWTADRPTDSSVN